MVGELRADRHPLPVVESVERALGEMAGDARQALEIRWRMPRTSAPAEPNWEVAKAWPSTSGSARVTPGTLLTRSVTAS